MIRRLTAIAAACGLFLAGPALPGPAGSVALGHAELSASIPGAGQILIEPPPELRLVFSEPLEPDFSSVSVLDPAGATVISGAGEPDPNDPYTLVVADPGLDEEGIYTVRWSALSAADGHTTGGTFTFGLGDVVPPASGVELGGGSLHEGHGAGLAIIETESRALSYLGLLLALGLPIIGFLVLRRPVSARVLALVLGLATIGSAGVLWVSAETAGIDLLTYATAGRSGQLFLARTLAALIGTIVVYLLARAARPREANVAAVVAGIAGLVAVAFGGHASAYASPAPLLAILIHLAAASVWLAGVLAVAWLAFSRDPDRPPLFEVVPRFSGLALVAIALVGLTGLYSDWVQTRAPLDFSTPYGFALLVKILIAVAALAFGAFNYLDGGRDRPILGGFKRRVTLEAILAVAVVVATGNLTSGAPPAQSMPAELERQTVAATALGDGTQLGLEPGRPGVTRFVATIDAPATMTGASLGLEQVGGGAGITRYPLVPVDDSGGGLPRFIVGGTLIPAETRWIVTVIGLDADHNEVGRARYQFEMGTEGVVAGLAAPALDPGIVIAMVLLIAGLLLGVFALAGGGLPRADPRTARLASLAGSVGAVILGLTIIVAGQL